MREERGQVVADPLRTPIVSRSRLGRRRPHDRPSVMPGARSTSARAVIAGFGRCKPSLLSENLGLRTFELLLGQHPALAEVGELVEVVRGAG